MPKTTVVVPIFNVARWLSECLTSIQSQTSDDFEVVAVNDGSTDASGELADEFAQEDDRFRVIHTPNRGVSEARNLGLSSARGRYVCFVDADDVLAPRFLENMVGLAEDCAADFVVSRKSLRSASERHETPFRGEIVSRETVSKELLYPGIPIGSWNKLYRRSVIEQNHLRFRHDLFMGEGQLFILEFAKHSRRTVMTSDSCYYYRVDRPGSAVTDESLLKWQNAWQSLVAIRSEVGDLGREGSVALEFHEWETCYLILRFLYRRPAGRSSRLGSECLRLTRRSAPRLLRHAEVSLTYKFKIFGLMISPSGLFTVGRVVSRMRRWTPRLNRWRVRSSVF